VIERRQDHRLATKILDQLFLLLLLDTRLDHFLDGALDAAEVLILCDIDGAMPPAADLPTDLVSIIEELLRQAALGPASCRQFGCCAESSPV